MDLEQFLLFQADINYDIGEIKIDGLEPTSEMKDLIEKVKRGEITIDDIRNILGREYKMKP